MDKIRTGIYVSGDVLAECDDYCTKQDIRREAVNNVRRTRGKINLDDLITRNFDEGIADDE